MSISSSFQQAWERFLSAEQLPNEPLLYQHITDQVLELLLKSKLPAVDQSTREYSENDLTFEEQNAVQYIGGYVIRSLHQSTKNSDVKYVLYELKAEDNRDGPAQDYTLLIEVGSLKSLQIIIYNS